jgi:hypothetical protein
MGMPTAPTARHLGFTRRSNKQGTHCRIVFAGGRRFVAVAVNPGRVPCFGHISGIFVKGSNQLAGCIASAWEDVGPASALPSGCGGKGQLSLMALWRSWHRLPGRVLAPALLLVGAVLSGCSSHLLVDNLPASVGGLPEGTPERPATPPSFPAVHDMPPARGDVPLNEAQKKRLQDELIATRERAARQAGSAGSMADDTQPSGSARNP